MVAECMVCCLAACSLACVAPSYKCNILSYTVMHFLTIPFLCLQLVTEVCFYFCNPCRLLLCFALLPLLFIVFAFLMFFDLCCPLCICLLLLLLLALAAFL